MSSVARVGNSSDLGNRELRIKKNQKSKGKLKGKGSKGKRRKKEEKGRVEHWCPPGATLPYFSTFSIFSYFSPIFSD
jgi:hypothetical protein